MLLRFGLLGGGRMLVISCLLLLSQLSESFLLPSSTSSSSSSSTTTATNFVCAPHTHCNAGHNIVSSCKYLTLSSSSSSSAPSRRRRHGDLISLSANKQRSSSSTTEEEKKVSKPRRRTWEESFQLLISYKEQHGNCNVPTKYKDDRRLGRWVVSQRQRKDRLSDDRIAQLNDLGFLWSNELSDEKWEKMFEKLQEYTEIHGNCIVPIKYKEDPRLGSWVHIQRQGKDKLSDERIDKLDDLGFSWSKEIFEDQWEEMFEKLVQYAKENNGDCNLPGNHDNNDVNKELYKWVQQQRSRKSLLSEEHQSKLTNLGLIWEDSDKVKADQKWNEKYERLKEYKQKYGHCRVPIRWKDDRSLGKWVDRQRQNYRKGLVREDRQIKLEEIGFSWKVRDGNAPDVCKLDLNWLIKFARLINFLEAHGHCDVSRYYKQDKSLAIWVQNQRENQKYGTLRQDRKEQLDDIGFTWSFDDQKDAQWNEKCKELIRFKEKNGHLRLPQTSNSLSRWVTQQRVLFANGRMDPKRKALLDEIEFRWEIQNSSSLS